MNLRKNKVGDSRIKGNVSRKAQLRMFITWALPAVCTIAAAGTPVYAVGVATAGPRHLPISSLWGEEDDKSYKRLLQTEVQTTTATVTDEVHDDHDHTEEEEGGHDDHKDELIDYAEVSCRLPHLVHLLPHVVINLYEYMHWPPSLATV